MRATTSIALALAAATSVAPASARAFEVAYLHGLASPAGLLKASEAKLSYDAGNRELWVVTGGVARVFNQAGMETFAFGSSEELGMPRLVAGLEGGDLVVVSVDAERWRVTRCNFRGEAKGELALSGAPKGFLEGFQPDGIVVRGERIYLASFMALKVVGFGLAGAVFAARDFREEIDFAGEETDPRKVEEKKASAEMGGFDVDADGNVLFTLKTMFSACIAPPLGKPTLFGVKGSAPGKFQVISAIARGDDGSVYVSDVLKNAVIVFDRNLNFVKEFGYRGNRPHSLVGPTDLVVAGNRLFVSQRANRGVSVFRVSAASTQ